jgi:hypothetical protein
MISKMFGDIASFVIIWAIFLIGFSGAIHLSVMAQVGGEGLVQCTPQLQADGRCETDADLVEVELGNTLTQKWIFRAYFQGFGDFWLDEQAPAGIYPMAILMVYTMTMNLLLVNLLIATMSTTYAKVLDHSEVAWMYEKYETTREYMDISSLPIPVLFLFWLMSNTTRLLHNLASGRWSEHEENRKKVKIQALELLNQADEPLESLIERCRDALVRNSASDQEKDNEQVLVQSMGGVFDRLVELELKVTKHGEHTNKVMSSLRSQEEDAADTKIQESAVD